MEKALNLASLPSLLCFKEIWFQKKKGQGTQGRELQNKMNCLGYLDFHFRWRRSHWYMGSPVDEDCHIHFMWHKSEEDGLIWTIHCVLSLDSHIRCLRLQVWMKGQSHWRMKTPGVRNNRFTRLMVKWLVVTQCFDFVIWRNKTIVT